MEINKAEFIEWFWDKFNSCYLVKRDDYPESIFMYYDPQYIRKCKLSNILGEKINKTDITGICLFQQDWKNTRFYCNFDEIWSYIYSNCSNNYDEIQQFISDRLDEHSNVLTPGYFYEALSPLLEEHSKMSVLTPLITHKFTDHTLEEHSKMSVLTPFFHVKSEVKMLEEHSKMSVLTPLIFSPTNNSPLEEHSKMSVLTPKLRVLTSTW